MDMGIAVTLRKLVLAHARQRFVFGVSNIGHTLGMAAIDAIYIALLVGSWFYMPQGLFLLLVLGYGTMIMIHVPIFEHVFRKYMK